MSMCVLFLRVENEAQVRLNCVHRSGNTMQQTQDFKPLFQSYELMLQHKSVLLIWNYLYNLWNMKDLN